MASASLLDKKERHELFCDLSGNITIKKTHIHVHTVAIA
jgi:hypothetical protein